MRLPNPYSLEETLEQLRHGLAVASNEDALTLLEKAVTKARDDEAYAKRLEETLLQGSTIEIRECLSCFGDYFERSRDAPPYYPHHDAVNGIDCALYAILFDEASRRRAGTRITPASPNQDHQVPHHDPDISTQPTRPPHRRWPFAF
ncbi:hypothetical protein [Aeromonas sp. A35_P]|uniref:hypothetical protein n=1 Tax=Aeromonas sp. A35_P TaxID=1983805 RepID=UPI0020CBAFE9|nr:hypothetical protein [Aeromonas sp. A35_P]